MSSGVSERAASVRRTLLSAVVVPLVAPYAARAQSRDGWPAIASGGVHRHGTWVWHELLSSDPQAAAAFLAQVFGWTIQERGVGERRYRLALQGDRPVAGVLRIDDGRDGRTPASRWLAVLSVPDVDAAIARSTALGGRTLAGPAWQLGRGRVALLADPEGAAFGVIRTLDGDPDDTLPSANRWLWNELWAGDGARMAAYYRELGNYTLRRLAGGGDRDEWLLTTGDTPRAGVITRLDRDQASAWLPYLRVADLSATLRAVAAAGGRVLLEPSPQRRGGQVAIVADPTGAALGVAQWSQERAR